MIKPALAAIALAIGLGGAQLAAADDAKPIKIALIASKTGPFETYARDTERGFRLGLEYYTQGTMKVIGRDIELIVKDDQFKPDLSKVALTEAYSDDKVDIAVGTSWSGGALAIAPIAEEYKKLLIVEPAIADSLTGASWNRYLFRASRNSFQDALASAAVLKDGDTVAFLAPDYVYGKDGVAAYKAAVAALNRKVTFVHDEFIPASTSDFTAPMQRISDSLKDAQGKKYVVVIWGAPNPIRKLSELNPGRYGIEFISIGGSNLETMKGWKGLDVSGGAFYYYGFPKNPINDWLVKENEKRFNQPPDLFTAGGFLAASAIISGIKAANSTDTEKLIAAMEGMEFDTPKGKVTFRKEDHQGLQTQYVFKTKKDSADPWDLLELVREVPPSELPVPVTVNR
jgi:branched-chain amino acid transport system substrate-binding protein